MTSQSLKESATLVGDGVTADIWYDAKAQGDIANEAFIASVQSAMQELSRATPKLVDALQEIEELLKGHPEFEKGNSKVHLAVHKARSALAS